MKGVFVVKCGAVCPQKEKGEKPQVAVFNLLVEADTYTLAEGEANKFFEKNLLKKKYSNFSVDQISTESYNQLKVLSAPEDIDYAKVYKVRVTFGYDEEKKPNTSTVLIVASDLEEASTGARDHIKDLKSASYAYVVEAKESKISTHSPVFVKQD